MCLLARRYGAFLAASLMLWSLAPGTARTAEPDTGDREYQNLVLAVDVSSSMYLDLNRQAANDKEGMGWDGIQFVIDAARPKDRIALVLFAGDARIASWELDPRSPGFVQMDWKDGRSGKDGRTILKELVAQIQKQELGATQRIVEYNLTSLRPGTSAWKIRLKEGTSVIKTLDLIKDEKLGLLNPPSPTRRTRVFLFTDGEERPPAEKIGYEYIDTLQRLERELAQSKESSKFDAWVNEQVKDFRKHEVPIFTFALGSHCDDLLLRTIAERSQPEAQIRDDPAQRPSPTTIPTATWAWSRVSSPSSGPCAATG